MIKKLSKSEKRYFVLSAKLQQGDKAYLQLFKEIDKMAVYDEAVLKKRLQKKEVKIAQLHVTKNHLSQQILKSLRAFHEKKSMRQRLFALMSDADLLESKGLYKQCLKKLKSAKVLAKKHELHRYRAEIVQKEIILKMRNSHRGFEELLREGYSELAEASAFSQKEARLFEIMHKLFFLYQTSGKSGYQKVLDYIASLENHELLQATSDRKDSFESKLNYFYIHAFCHHLKGEFEKANLYHQKVLEIWGKHPHILAERSSSYKRHLANYLNGCHTIGFYKPFPRLLERFKTLRDNNFSDEASSFQNYYFLSLLYYMNTLQFQKALGLVADIEEGFKKYEGAIIKSRELLITVNVFHLYFALEDFGKALEWINKIPRSKKIEARNDTQLFASVMRLIVHFELGNFWILDDMSNSVYRDLKKAKQLQEFEGAVLGHIRKLQKITSPKEVKKQYLEFEKTLKAIKGKAGSGRIMGLTEVIVWAACRAKEVSYVDELKSRMENGGT